MYIVISFSKGELSKKLPEKLKSNGFNKFKEGIWIGTNKNLNPESIVKKFLQMFLF